MFSLLARLRPGARAATAELARTLAYDEARELADSHSEWDGHNAGEPYDLPDRSGYAVSCTAYRCDYTDTVKIGA